MTPTQACLAPWQIDLAALFSSRLQHHTTEENLSRLESFITAYFLFERIFIAEKYRGSAFIAALDREGEIFLPDPEISGSYPTDSNGQALLAPDPSLLFKNRGHLRSKSSAWLKQHMTMNATREQREELLEYLQKTGSSASAWFYQALIVEYQTLFGLGMLNQAYSVLCASLSRIYLPDFTEIPRFVSFLDKALRKRANRMSPREVSGVFSFELPTGGVEARLSIPPFFATLLEHLRSQPLTVVLPELRRAYEPVREAFRPLAAAFAKHRGDDLVAADMAGKELDEWNNYVKHNFKTSDKAVLLKSEVIAVELHAGLADSELRATLTDRIKSKGSLLRLSPPHSFLAYSRKPGALRPLGVESALAFERKLFRIGRGYRNKRRVLHGGLACVISFPLSPSAQLPQEDLNDPAIRALGDKDPPHLYMLCTRPRISVNPAIRRGKDWIEVEFQFHHGTHIESERIGFSTSTVRNVIVKEGARTQVVIDSHMEGRTASAPSLLYQNIVKSMLSAGAPPPLLGPEGRFLSKEQRDALAHVDLEVIYIGQSRGKDFDKTAITRLDYHEKWAVFNRHIAAENPHQEIWILLIRQSPPYHLNVALPNSQARDPDAAELMRRLANPARLDCVDRLNFIEAALINYFKPRYNDKFKKGVFPSQHHESYEQLLMSTVDIAAIELDTAPLGCRLYSPSVEPRFAHVKTCQFNPAFDMEQLFPRK